MQTRNRGSLSSGTEKPSSTRGNSYQGIKDKTLKSSNGEKCTANQVETVKSQQRVKNKPQEESRIILVDRESSHSFGADNSKNTSKNEKITANKVEVVKERNFVVFVEERMPHATVKENAETAIAIDKSSYPKTPVISENGIKREETKNQPQERSSGSLVNKRSPQPDGKDNSKIATTLKASRSSKTVELARSENDGNEYEDKLKLKKSLPSSLTVLLEKDAAKSIHNFKPKVSEKAELKGKALSEELSKSEELSNSLKSFDLKLHDKIPKNPETLARLYHCTRGIHGTRGASDTRVGNFDNVKVLIEDSTNLKTHGSNDAKNPVDRNVHSASTGRTLSLETDKKAGKLSTDEHARVKLSVNGDHITIPSVRARKNSVLNGEENGDSSSSRERGSLRSPSDELKTVIFKDAALTNPKILEKSVRPPSFNSNDKHYTLVIEKGLDLHAKETAVTRSPSQSSTNSSTLSVRNNKRLSCSSREASVESTESKPRTSSSASDKQADIVNSNNRTIPLGLAHLLAKDDCGSPESYRHEFSYHDSADIGNVYKDKLKGLKKTTPSYASGIVVLDDRGNNLGRGSSNSTNNGEVCSGKPGTDSSHDRNKSPSPTEGKSVSQEKASFSNSSSHGIATTLSTIKSKAHSSSFQWEAGATSPTNQSKVSSLSNQENASTTNPTNQVEASITSLANQTKDTNTNPAKRDEDTIVILTEERKGSSPILQGKPNILSPSNHVKAKTTNHNLQHHGLDFANVSNLNVTADVNNNSEVEESYFAANSKVFKSNGIESSSSINNKFSSSDVKLDSSKAPLTGKDVIYFIQ